MAAEKKNKRILLCDDEEDTRSLVSSIFESTDFDIDSCPNGNQAVKQVKKKEYDLMLLDIMMPGKNFEQVADEVHKISPKTKVVLFSVVQYADNERKRLLSKPNIHLYIQKPVGNDELVESVKKVLKKK